MFQFCLVDLLDKRYNSEVGISILPYLNFKWSGEGKGRIYILSLGWINMEVSVLAFNVDHYADLLEDLINNMDDKDE